MPRENALTTAVARLAVEYTRKRPDHTLVKWDSYPLAVHVPGHLGDALRLIARFGHRRIVQRPVPHFDRVGPPRHFDDRRAVEVFRKANGVARRRGDDDLQLRAFSE